MNQEIPQTQDHMPRRKWAREAVKALTIIAGWWTTLGFLMYAPLWMRLLAISCIVIAVVILLAEA